MESYDVLSNLIHGRESPVDGMKNPMNEEAIQKGIVDLMSLINGYDSYPEFLREISTQYLLQELQNDSVYFRVLVIRLLFERNKSLMTMLRRKHPEAFKFLNETNHIENDYVFQLDPERFYSIPEVYVQEIHNFLEVNREAFETLGQSSIEE